MRLSIILIPIVLAGCSYQQEQVSSKTSTIAMPAAYAAPAPIANRQDDCAENFNGIVSNLEGLMSKAPQQAN